MSENIYLKTRIRACIKCFIYFKNDTSADLHTFNTGHSANAFFIDDY